MPKVICFDFDNTLGRFEFYSISKSMNMSSMYGHMPEFRPGIYKFMMDLKTIYRDVVFVITTQAKKKYVKSCLSNFPAFYQLFDRIYSRKQMTGNNGKNYYIVANDFGVDATDLIAIGDSYYDRDNFGHFVSIKIDFEISIQAVKHLMVFHLGDDFLAGYEKLPDKFYIDNRYLFLKNSNFKQIIAESMYESMFKWHFSIQTYYEG
ncbi:MAG: NIF family HAD-type phosphatase [Candidatus Hodarchaeales archaeon]